MVLFHQAFVSEPIGICKKHGGGAHVYTCVCWCIHSCSCLGKPEVSVICLPQLLFILSLWVRVFHWSWSSRSGLAQYLPITSFQCWGHRHEALCPAFMWVLKIDASALGGKHFVNCGFSPATVRSPSPFKQLEIRDYIWTAHTLIHTHAHQNFPKKSQPLLMLKSNAIGLSIPPVTVILIHLSQDCSSLPVTLYCNELEMKR